MSKRYYCDFCDKSFSDNLDSRKKHQQGTFHTRNRKFHYSQYRDLKSLYEEESVKTECRRFLQTGHCHFGDHCNYTHYSREQLNYIKLQVEEQHNKITTNLPSVNAWLAERNKKSQSSEASFVPPIYLPESADLPISLWPMNFIESVNVELSEWG